MPEHQIVQEAADAAASKIRGGMEFTTAVRAALRGKNIEKSDWGEYFSAVAAELGKRGRDMQPRRPVALGESAPPKPKGEQLGLPGVDKDANLYMGHAEVTLGKRKR